MVVMHKIASKGYFVSDFSYCSLLFDVIYALKICPRSKLKCLSRLVFGFRSFEVISSLNSVFRKPVLSVC